MAKNTDKGNTTKKEPSTPKPPITTRVPEPTPFKQPSGEMREHFNGEVSKRVDTPKDTDR